MILPTKEQLRSATDADVETYVRELKKHVPAAHSIFHFAKQEKRRRARVRKKSQGVA